ncbi:MAG: hypothetical protein ACD_30C00001G0002 [uncultured bacterium]|uniref:Transcription elongation factor GreA/GreB N-terminal domain-containing protein n=4 Tax=Candidatus Daviesiibacteriota TaxID=1752718 RepID=A0A0G0FA41_9BACT|nr:MAG: hypothetical protein ACD_30C00001G0002 [uncultured bacterium]KKQ10390.1 MAG: hypothetical protein US19_C0005G0002 [Candidatus Daviesbacteria bacterium GW2011_GWB1_36_5]KKQ15769.1 MAG: hypothetical protein US28_C0010G0002 [Candidatus Daviesbacteria bacterium GW2011_GWA1_36_8]OGE16551.1 MAG: hypothetical protein A2858_01750 [Candidatus Daviesbacteria bacterium RIFCSPHIGHO2_01_FULL_36_37]OGE31766.1 MAG: hypothetical protein A3C99_03050 [Candidatus Daviesbacteria bacterium RIFCSPHIGHO2_02_F
MEKLSISDWKKKLKMLEEEDLPKAMARVGESASTGDWNENAEFEDAERQLEVIRQRINDIRSLIKSLEAKKKK